MPLAVERVARPVGRAHINAAVRRLRQRSVHRVRPLQKRGLVHKIDGCAVTPPNVLARLTHNHRAVFGVGDLHEGGMLFLVKACGLQLCGQQTNALAHLPEQAGRVAQLVHVGFLARPVAHHHPAVKQPHPHAKRNAEPAHPSIARLLHQAVFPARPALLCPANEFLLLWEQQERRDRFNSSLHVARVEGAAKVGDKRNRVRAVVSLDAAHNGRIGPHTLHHRNAAAPHRGVIRRAPVEGRVSRHAFVA